MLLFIGSTVADVVVRLPALPRTGDDLHVLSQQVSLGGCAYNAFRAARLLGAEARLFSSVGGGVCFRAIVGGKMGYASTELLSAEQAKALVQKAADNASVLESEEQVFLGEGGQIYEPLPNREYPLPTTEELITKVLEVQEKIYAADPMVIDGCATTGIIERNEVAIVNSNGLDLSLRTSAAGLVVVGVVSNGTDMANDYQIKLGQLDKMDADTMIAKAVATAKESLGGEVPPTGVYNVVFDPEAMATC